MNTDYVVLRLPVPEGSQGRTPQIPKAGTSGNASCSYDNEGRVSSIDYPNRATGLPATVPYNYAYDGTERPTGISTTYNGNTTNQVSNVLYGPSNELLNFPESGPARKPKRRWAQ